MSFISEFFADLRSGIFGFLPGIKNLSHKAGSQPNEESEVDPDLQNAENEFRLTLLLIFGGLGLINILTWLLIPPLRTSDGGTVLFHFGAFISTLSVLYVLASWRFDEQVGPDKIVVFLRFGKPLHQRGSGLPFAPRFFFTLQQLDVDFKQYQFPAEDHLIYKGEMKDPVELPKGMKPATRITFSHKIENIDEAVKALGAYELEVLDPHQCRLKAHEHWSDFSDAKLDEMEREAKEKQEDGSRGHLTTVTFTPEVPSDGLDKRVTAEAVFIIAFRVYPEKAMEFIRKIGTVDEAKRQIEDEMVSVVNRYLPKMSVGQARANLAWINAHLFLGVLKRTYGWGIRVDRAYMKDIPLHHTLNRAISDTVEAEFKGRADKELAIRRGEGAAQAAKDLLIGRAEGQAKMMEMMDVSGQEILAAETLREVGNEGNLVILGTDGIAQGAAIAKAMFGQGDKKPAPKQIESKQEE